MKIATFFITAVCLTIGLYSCGETPSSPPQGVTTTQSMPLKVGNWWKYVSPDCNNTSAYILKEIVDYKFIGAHYYYVMASSRHNDSGFYQYTYMDTLYWRYDGSRLLVGATLGDTTIAAESEIFDESYTIVPFDSTRRANGYSVVSDTASVVVPAGTFTNCVDIWTNDNTGTDVQVNTCIAPTIGIIQESWFKTTMQLKEYHIVP